MKRALMFACALAFAGMASAVTINWNGTDHEAYSSTTSVSDATGSSHNIVVNPTTISSAASFVACAEITISNLTDLSSRSTIAYLAGLTTTSTSVVATKNASATNASLYFYTNTTTPADTGSTLANGTVTIVYSYDADAQTLTAYVSTGSTTYVGTSTNVEFTTFSVGGYAGANSPSAFLDSFADYTAVTYVVEDATAIYNATTDTITIVPEPTVLALLALGVAGLALKRKVA